MRSGLDYFARSFISGLNDGAATIECLKVNSSTSSFVDFHIFIFCHLPAYIFAALKSPFNTVDSQI